MPEVAPAVAIVGMAVVYPGAGDLDTYWSNIVGRVDSIREVSPDRLDARFFHPDPPPGEPRPPADSSRIYCKRGGFVDELATFDPAAFGVVPVAVDWAEADQFLSLRVASEAIDDAGGLGELGDPRKVGVVVGRGGYNSPGLARMDQRVKQSAQLVTSLAEIVPTLTSDQLEAVRSAFVAKLGPERPEAAIGLVPNLAASRIANRLDLSGPAYTVDAACASSLIAVDTAVRELSAGRADAMVVGGAHLCHDVTFWSVFSLLRALSPSQQIRPFDRRADGLLIGEGVGMVVLKRLADADAAGDRVYAVIRGSGVASDGRASSVMSPRVDGQVLAIERAWQDAGLDPTAAGAIDLIEAHGTGTPAGDLAELTTMGRVFGDGRSATPIGIGSVKSMIGHTMPAAGAAGLIKAALALHHRTLPPTLHCEEPHPAFDGTRFRPVTEAAEWTAGPGRTRRAGVNAFGFGGINAHLVVSEAPVAAVDAFPVAGVTVPGAAVPGVTVPGVRVAGAAVPAPALTSPVSGDVERVLMLVGADAADLARQLAVPDEDLLARDDAAQPPSGGPFRMAIVAPTPRRLGLARSVVERGTAWRGRSDLWFTGAPLLADGAVTGPAGTSARGRLAFMFCGLEAVFKPRVDDVADYFGLPRPVTEGLDALGQHGVASVTVGRVLDIALRRIGVVPDLVGGHSIGEWNAMMSSGMLTDDYIDDFIAAFDPADLEVPGVVFGAVGCGADVASEAIEGLPDIVLSHDNCTRQSIVCGESASVTTALERLRRRGVMGVMLPFKSGFHSPFIAPYLSGSFSPVAVTQIHRPRVPVWSATTVAPYPDDPEGVSELAVRHLLEPVRFTQLIRRMHDEGVRVFVQVGVGSVGSFIADTLAGTDHMTIASNAAKRPGIDQLRRVAAALWVEGAAPRLDVLPCATRPQRSRRPVREKAAPTATTRLLRLGAPLVHLGESARALVPSEAVAVPPAQAPAPVARARGAVGHPVVDTFDEVVRDAEAALSMVADLWANRPVPAGGGPGNGNGPGNGTGPGNGSGPVSGTGPGSGGGPGGGEPASVTITRTLSVATMPDVADHCFYLQPPGWPDLADRFPVVPLTGLCELMADEARKFRPGRTVVGLRDVRALRWLAIEPPVDVTIRVSETSDGAVRVAIDGYARGTVDLADDYAPAPLPSGEPLPDETPSPLPAEEFYSRRWLFHGPGYRGIERVDAVSPGGVRAGLVCPTASGSLLDSAGQLFGIWPRGRLAENWLLLPSVVRSMRFFGPHPAPGDRLQCVVRIREVTDRLVTADIEMTGADGRVWALIEGWTDRRFALDEVLWDHMLDPHRCAIGEPRDGGWTFVRERWGDSASRELALRHYLDADGRATFAGRTPNAARPWLLGRIAAKDAVRRWLWDRGAGPVWGVETVVTNEPSGRPVVGPLPRRPDIPVLPPPHLSIAHSGSVAVALVHADGDVGIDVERVQRREPGVEALALAESEGELLDDLAGGDPDARAFAFTRIWSAKEAAAKADGTGLAGRPRQFVVDRVAGDRMRVTIDGGRTRWVATRLIDAAGHFVEPPGPADTSRAGPDDRVLFVVAWTSPDTDPHPGADRHPGTDPPAGTDTHPDTAPREEGAHA